MDLQNIIVGIIILAAFLYVGKIVWRKAKSFSSKNSCGADCGCDTKATPKNSFIQINKLN